LSKVASLVKSLLTYQLLLVEVANSQTRGWWR